MQWPPNLCKPENQTTRAILVVRIVFYDLTFACYGVLHLGNADVFEDALVNGMLEELILPS
jgi:hypothetical protein